MDSPGDIADYIWERAQTVADQFEGDEGTTYTEYWKRVEIIARLIVAVREEASDEAYAKPTP